MATFARNLSLSQSVTEVYSLFLNPQQTILLAPPDLHLTLVEGPALLELGKRLTRSARRWGVSQRVVSEVTGLETNVLVQETQVQGPFRRWIHSSHFTAGDANGCLLRETIDFEPPGGLLGLLVTEKFLLKDLEGLFDFRHQKLQELLVR